MSFDNTFTFHGVKFFCGSLAELKTFLRSCLENSNNEKTIFIATPNPEFYVNCVFDRNFHSLLKNTSFNIVDGIGLYIFLRLRGYPSTRITGSGLVDELFSNNFGSFYLLGGMNGVYEMITKRFQNVNFVGGYDGIVNAQNTRTLCHEINNLKPDFLLVGLGSPKQEMWIKDNIQHLCNVKVAIGIGGSLDFASLQVNRAPKCIQSVGLEWLFRLIQQPYRFTRIAKAVVAFPFLFISVEVISLINRIIKGNMDT